MINIKIGALNEYEEEMVLWGCHYYDFKLPVLWILFLICQIDKWGLLGNPICRRTVINTYPGLSLRGRGWGFPPATKNVAPEYFNIQASRVSRFRFLGNAWWDRRSRKVSTNSRISAITEYSFQLRVCLPFILAYFSVFNSSTTKPNRLHTS